VRSYHASLGAGDRRADDPQVDVAPQLFGPLSADLQHPRAELDPGQPHVGGVVGQIAPGSDRELEDVTVDP
jgi:hypothetical protein